MGIMKYVIIENGVVVNTAIADAPQAANWIQSETAGIGWVDVEGVLTAPAAPEPAPASRILTHLQFRRRFTPEEQELADELEVTFESNPAFTPAQKRTLRTGYKNFYAASEVDLDDPAIPPMLGMYVVAGVLAANRPAEILA